MRRFLPVLLMLWAPPVFAANTFVYNAIEDGLDLVTDVTNLGTITGVAATFTDLDCTAFSNGGAVTTDANGVLRCSDDDSTAGGAAPTNAEYLVSALNASLSAEDLVTEGLAIDYTNAAGTGTFDFDPTELTGARTWGNGTDASMVWTYNLSGTDPVIGYHSGSVTVSGALVTTSGMQFENFDSCTLTTSPTGFVQCGSGGAGGGNSFETIAVPAGTNPVADSSTDTLTITETSFLTLTGTAGTDTIDITQVTTDLGTDGLIAANAVALTTDTTGDYVATVADGTGVDGTATGEGSTYTPTLDFTEISSLTWGTGTFTTMTFNAGATDPVLTAASDNLNLTTGNFTVGATTGLGALAVDGGSNEIQLLVQGNSTQTAFLSVLENSGGTDVVTIANSGATSVSGVLTAHSSFQLPGFNCSGQSNGGALTTTSAGWVICSPDDGGAGGSGDIEDVGNCSTGACFTGSSGDTLTFFNDSQTATISYTGGATQTFTFDDEIVVGTDVPFTMGASQIKESSSSGNVELSNDLDVTGSVSATNTVSGVVVSATGVLRLPTSTSPTMSQTGTLAFDTTSGQLVVFDGTLTDVAVVEQGKCATIENAVAADDNVPVYIFEDAATMRRTSCYTTSMTTQPTYQLEDGNGNAVTGAATCSSVPFDWTTTTSGNAFIRAEALRLDITNTPAPTTGTFTTICWVYTVDRR